MRLTFLLLLSVASVSMARLPVPHRPAKATNLQCAGPEVVAGRQYATRWHLAPGRGPKACFGRLQLYPGRMPEIVAAEPSPDCPGQRQIQIYEQSRVGPWFHFFEAPVCGDDVRAGPLDDQGEATILIDGRAYRTVGGYYVPAG